MKVHKTLLALATAFSALSLSAQTNGFDIDMKKVGAPIQPTMYGIFFEDINYAADGGLYAELVKNRSFEFPYALQGWKAFGNVEIREDGPFDRCPHYARLKDPGHAHKQTGLDNEGFFGIGVEAGKTYRFSVWARVPDGRDGSIRVELVNTASSGENQFFVQQTVKVSGSEWKKYEAELKPEVTDPKAVLRIFLDAPRATVDLEHVSLMPGDALEGIYRRDLAQALADLHPGIFRFPGGCIVEGTDLETRYNWKNSVGPAENRPINENRWEYTFPHRFFPDYFQSYGLGFYEFFLLSEIIGSEPLPILSCGLACQFQNDDPKAHVPVEELQPYIQDALDLIEFANGGTDTKWGALRAEMGHPKPFNLKMVGVGNENWGQDFLDRYLAIAKIVREKHPEIKLVSTAGASPIGGDHDLAWKTLTCKTADMVDEHFYANPGWMMGLAHQFDGYDRSKPKVYAGEYACHVEDKANSLFSALCEAVCMMGFERNCDVVEMSSYAPLFGKIGCEQWKPDLIWFDNLRAFTTPNYHVQKMFGNNLPSVYIPSAQSGEVADFHQVCGFDKATGEYVVKCVNLAADHALDLVVDFGVELPAGKIKVETLTGNPKVVNDMENPVRCRPESKSVAFAGGREFKTSLPASSLTIIRAKE